MMLDTYSFICQAKDLLGLCVKLPLFVSTCLPFKGTVIPLNDLCKGTTSDLAGLFSTLTHFSNLI